MAENTVTEAGRTLGRRRLNSRVPVILYADEWGGYGGTANYVVMLARGLRRRGYQVAAICHRSDGVAGMRDALSQAGVDVRAIEGTTGTSPRARLHRLRDFVSLFREYPGAVLGLMMGYFTRGGAATLAAAVGGAAGIVSADLTPPEPPISRKSMVSLRLKDRLVDRIVVGAIENREAFARQTGRNAAKVDVVHTGIELERFQPGEGRESFRQEFGLDRDAVVVGTMSRLDDQRKGVAYFLDMVAQVAPRWPQARFMVVGQGVLRPGLERRAAELGIAHRIIFTGWRPDTQRVFAGMDIFVMPSIFEGGPTTILEAMAMATPVIASRVGMVPEVITDGQTGLIVPPGDASALANALSRLLGADDLQRCLASCGREKAVASFSIDTMVDRYLEVFADALEDRAQHRLRRIGF